MTEKNMYIFYFTLTLSTWKVKVAQSCLTLCNPMDYSLPGSSVHGDSSGKNTGVAISFSRGSSQPRDQPESPMAPALQEDSLPYEAPGKPLRRHRRM